MSFGILNLQPPSTGITPIAVDTNGYQASVSVPSGVIVYTGYNLPFTPQKTGIVDIIIHVASSNDILFNNAHPGIAVVTTPQSNGTQLLPQNPPVLVYSPYANWVQEDYLFTPDPPAVTAAGTSPPTVMVLRHNIIGLSVGTTYYASLIMQSGSTTTATENIQVFKAIIIEY